ncbi:methionyl-tRNA formyltransferase [Brachybacterium sp. EF45031]|uniref:methionyl-tRNA formyltransferase n=1 Tax=Brachybacterium sillae TaxID=2810536 RepID=UPI00217CDAAD|nr:methionyl-tRNA formyltransferase [Brachybacterium sillae]MCS6710674.1 methionyl-tRNA formyltransferase [Brachybacterium sillae]
MRVIFAGTPDTAVPSLRALHAGGHDIVGVLTRPDAPTGRGRRLTPSPVRVVAEELGLPMLTPTSLRDEQTVEWIRERDAQVAVVVAYGALVPAPLLTALPLGWVNLHFSLLPQWRGAAPVQHAVLAGQDHTGVSVFQLAEGLDTGDVLVQEETPIGPFETSGDLLERLAEHGAGTLLTALARLEDGTADPRPQDDAAATAAPKLTTAGAALDPRRPAGEVSAHIRGMSPRPGAWALLDGQRIKILGVAPLPTDAPDDLPPGALHATRRALLLGTGTTPIALGTIAPAGKRPMPAADWARGASLGPDATLTLPEETR